MKKLLMHVISGTHWDREWRHTAEQSKPRLVELIDGMMDTLEKNPEYKTYCLDGGYVVIEDYLTVRPENEQRLRKLIDSGRVQFVNWYTLPETYTVAPEALIRNIKLGQEMAKKYGGVMRAGYTATSYGQTSQTPQIYNGFGIKSAIFYRGTNKHFLTPLFIWQGKDGSKLHTLRTFDEVTRTNWFFYVHQPLVVNKAVADLSHYYDRWTLPVHNCDDVLYERPLRLMREKFDFNRDPKVLKSVLDGIVNQAKGYQIGENLLALNMEDNDIPFAMLQEMIDALNKTSKEVELVQSSMDEYIDKIIKDTKNVKLPVHKGEIRTPAVEPGFNALLGATHSSRVKLKILNEQAETGLLYQAEPMSAFATMLGEEYPKAFFDRAWRYLLQNHAHDSICGAAVDQAHEDMLYNFSIARMIANELTARGTMCVFKHLDMSKYKDGDHTVTLFNTLPFARKQVAMLMIDFPKQVIGESCGKKGVTADNKIEHFDLVDENGKVIPMEILRKDDIKISVERDLDTKGIKMPATRWRVLAEVNVPAMGCATYAVRPRGPKYVIDPVAGPDRKLMARPSGILENENIRVQINSNGTFNLLDKATGRMMENMHYFTDNGEMGDAHLSKQPVWNPIHTSLGSPATITMTESNTLRGTYRIDLSITVPAAATIDGKERLKEESVIPITTWLTLEKGGKFLKIKTKLTNHARDHRLRVNFPTYVTSDIASVESAFAVEKRCIRWTDNGDNHEKFYPFQPMQNFVDVNDGKVGVAILNKGLREYEVQDDTARTIAITLLRTHRAYMTANSDMITEELDRYTGLQSFGTLEYQYAIYPHKGDWDKGSVMQAAYEHKVMMNAVQGVPGSKGKIAATGSFIKINPADKLMLSALKQADDGSGIVLRVWNTSSEKIDASIDISLPVKSASRIMLDETEIEKLTVAKGKIRLQVLPHKIETILFKS
jgi:mannosylglycerate hydrolase